MGLDLYAKVEPYLDFEDEVYLLHKQFMEFVMVNELDNIKKKQIKTYGDFMKIRVSLVNGLVTSPYDNDTDGLYFEEYFKNYKFKQPHNPIPTTFL